MSLDDDIWERGKCGYKAIQYMGCGLPVIVSPVDVNRSLVEHEVSGYHANNDEDWVKFSFRLSESSQLRHSMGSVNLDKVEESCSVRSQLDRIVDVLK